MGIFTWGAVYGERQADKLVLDTEILARLADLEKRAVTAENLRTVALTTKSLNIYVYPVESVGVVP